MLQKEHLARLKLPNKFITNNVKAPANLSRSLYHWIKIPSIILLILKQTKNKRRGNKMKSYILGVWNAIDPIYYNITRLHYVPDNDKQNTLFRVRLTRYKGPTVTLEDGTTIYKNDLLLKIHLHNVRMLSDLKPVKSDIKRAVLFYHMIKDTLPILSQYVLSHEKYKEIKGIIGITTLYRGANRLGFETVPIKNSYYRLYKKVTFLPINHIANASYQATPAYLFMSKETLHEKYSVQ